MDDHVTRTRNQNSSGIQSEKHTLSWTCGLDGIFKKLCRILEKNFPGSYTLEDWHQNILITLKVILIRDILKMVCLLDWLRMETHGELWCKTFCSFVCNYWSVIMCINVYYHTKHTLCICLFSGCKCKQELSTVR